MNSLSIKITKESDELWPLPDRIGRQDIEIVTSKEHVKFNAAKIGSLLDVQDSKDPEGKR